MQPHLSEILWRGRPRPRNLIRGIDRFINSRFGGASPGWRLRQTDTLQRLHSRERNQLVQSLAPKYLVDALAMTRYGRCDQQGIRC